MRQRRWGLYFLTLLIFPIGARAGLYNPAEPYEGPLDPNFNKFYETLAILRSIGMEGVQVDNPLRQRYFLVADLAPRFVPQSWPVERRISLSAYLIRRQKHQEAIELLKPLANVKRDNFLILSNLASALSGQEPALALDYLGQAIDVWPASWDKVPKEVEPLLREMGWVKSARSSARNSLAWFHRAETFHHKLLKLRARERPAAGKKASVPEQLDDLFGVRFVGESGVYEAGKLAAKEKAKLPADALAIVQQLLVWLPDDARLYWLLGEIYNGLGDVTAARQIFDSGELAGLNGRFRPRELREHLTILKNAPPPTPPEDVPPPEANKSLPTSPPPEGFSFRDLRAIAVGFGAGIVFSFMAYWQIREIRRRRQGKAK
jgi:tetratricopeptide (TPR) repeat protein